MEGTQQGPENCEAENLRKVATLRGLSDRGINLWAVDNKSNLFNLPLFLALPKNEVRKLGI